MKNTAHWLWLIGLSVTLAACANVPPAPPTPSPEQREQAALRKINIDLSEIDSNGLIGPADGKRRVAYEFCIPQDKAKQNEVSHIDASMQFYPGTPGRIRCSRQQILCIGEGGTRDVLLKLAQLDYIERIDPFYGE